MKPSDVGTTYSKDYCISVIKDEIKSLEAQIEEIDKTSDLLRFERFRNKGFDKKQARKQSVKLSEKKRALRKRFEKCKVDIDIIQKFGVKGLNTSGSYSNRMRRKSVV